MEKIDKFFSYLDSKFDKNCGFIAKFFKKYFFVISTTFFGLLVLLFMIRLFYSRPYSVASVIEDDIKVISLALKRIDKECNILSIEEDYNEINFLTVKSFDTSRVGPLSLAYPKKWNGPYVSVTPTIQDKSYELVKAGDGVFVMPGQGVHLPNGLVVGKDFVVDKNTKVASLLQKGGPLTYKDKQFAMKLVFAVGDWDPWFLKQKTVKEIDQMLERFVDRMSFTKNEECPFS